ncbi:MAG: acetate--CoA ligase family protein [Hyphomicrobiaceae bacterium]|nr:acetate--CoA ligase family protein [Hyphomicrobiaceae bacterium]
MPDISKLLWPDSVAIIGASPDATKIRGMVLEVILREGFAGQIYPVNPNYKELRGQPCYASVGDIPAKVDLAVLAIPAEAVLDEVRRCGEAGVKAAAIMTSGFAEQSGEEGAAMQSALAELIATYDMAVIGPNCLGFANFAASLYPTFSPAIRKADLPLMPTWHNDGGRVAVVAQSGAIGYSFYDRGRMRELPFRYVVTTGNEAGLNAFDLVEFMLDEGNTDVFVLFLESIKSAATFRRLAEKALRAGKPIIVVKVGRSEAGRFAASSHTASLAGSDRVNRAMFDAYGVIVVEDQDEAVDFASAFLLNKDRLPAGNRVGISTATGGGGGWLADQATLEGLDVPELDKPTRKIIDALLPAYGSSRNPVDATAQAVHAVGYGELTRLTGLSSNIDGVMVIMSARVAESFQKERERLREVGHSLKKPILAWTYTWPLQDTVALLVEAGFSLTTNIRNCARAMAAMLRYRQIREAFIAPLALQDGAGLSPLTEMAGAGGVIPEHAARKVLAAHGVGRLAGQLASSRAEAMRIAGEIGAPLAMKIQAAEIPHKTDAGGVALNVATPEAAGEAFDRLVAAANAYKPGAAIDGVLVEPMAARGHEIILGINADEVFGPMILVGAGGIYAEVLDDTVLSPPVATREAAVALIHRLKFAKILQGVRGQPPADVTALADAIVALSAFAVKHSGIVREVDINPVMVHEAGAGVSVLDALIITHGPASGDAH